MALTFWNDILNKPEGLEELPLKVSDLSASVLDLAEDIGEIAESVSGIAEELDTLDDSKVSPKLVLSIPANTYASYTLALAALEAAFSDLSDDEKKKTQLIRSDVIIYNLTAMSANSHDFSYCTCDANNNGRMFLEHIDLKAGVWISLQNSSGANSVTDYSSQAQTQKLDLYII